MAPTYDAGRFSGPSGRYLYETDGRIVREAVALVRPKKILDVPTGTGRVLDYLRDQAAPITGVDSTWAMLTRASRHVRSGHDSLLVGNAAVLPFGDASFDYLTSLRFFHLFDRSERVPFAKEFRRVLMPGGHLLLSMTNGWYAGGVNWLRRYVGQQTVYFEYPGELRSLFPGWPVVRVFGNFLPLQGSLNRVPALGPLLRWSVNRLPMSRLCWETFYVLRKP